jgi:hypothetical protein
MKLKRYTRISFILTENQRGQKWGFYAKVHHFYLRFSFEDIHFLFGGTLVTDA